jgi:methyl-accepting chemotaxis protein
LRPVRSAKKFSGFSGRVRHLFRFSDHNTGKDIAGMENMKYFRGSLNAFLTLGLSLVILAISAGLFIIFDRQARTSELDAAMKRQQTSLRVLVDRFATRFDGIDLQLDASGDVTGVTWDALPDLDGHDLIDAVGQISGETATLFAWVPEEGDFIRRTTNIIKPDGSRAVGTWLGKTNPVHAAMLDKQTYNGEAVILGKPYFTVYQPIVSPSGQMVGIFYVGMDRSVIDARIAENAVLGLIAAGIAVALGVTAVLLLLSRGLRPLRRVSARLDDMVGGDLDAPVPHATRSDDLGRTARAVEQFRGRLLQAQTDESEVAARRAEQHRVVAALKNGLERLANRDLTVRIEGTAFPPEYEALRADFDAGVASLSEAMEKAHAVAESVRLAASQIGSTSDDLAQRVETQAGTLVQSAEALNTLTETGQEIAKNAQTADDLAMNSRKLANESGEVVRSAIEAITRIERASEQINQIITAIDDIAFQTNLLALNAGVEASRAGAAGKGFAVVALEVRNLAQTAAASAQEIKTLIQSSNDEVQKGSDLVQKTGASLEQVQEQVESLGELITGVSSAVRRQTTGLTEINEGVQHLQNTTQHNAAVVEELNAAGQGLNDESSHLTGTLGVFTLPGGATPQAVPRAASQATERATQQARPASVPHAVDDQHTPRRERPSGEWTSAAAAPAPAKSVADEAANGTWATF